MAKAPPFATPAKTAAVADSAQNLAPAGKGNPFAKKSTAKAGMPTPKAKPKGNPFAKLKMNMK